MQDEVFRPILPVLEIDSVEAVIDWVNSHPRPLELHILAEEAPSLRGSSRPRGAATPA